MWETDIGIKVSGKDAKIDSFKELINKSVDIMQNKAESEFNPRGYHLSDEARQRLKWMYIIHFDNLIALCKKLEIS